MTKIASRGSCLKQKSTKLFADEQFFFYNRSFSSSIKTRAETNPDFIESMAKSYNRVVETNTEYPRIPLDT